MENTCTLLFSLIGLSMTISGCCCVDVKSTTDFKVPESSFDPSRTSLAPDYSNMLNWAVLPDMGADKVVDVVFFHPTSYFGDKSWNQSMLDERNDQRALEDITKQAAVFEGQCNIYAPFYRQASIHVLNASEKDKDSALGVGSADIDNAFKYYLENFNNGKPFILAGHSQGSNLLLLLLERNFDDPKLMKQLVAAYMIGWSVTADDLEAYPQLKVCESYDETCCIVSYNTQENNPEISVVRKGAIAVNPLLWNTSGEVAAKELNLGAVFNIGGARKEIPHYTGAQIVDGALVVPRPSNVKDLKTLRGFYHGYDYAFFYRNLEKNVADRIAAYQRTH